MNRIFHFTFDNFKTIIKKYSLLFFFFLVLVYFYFADIEITSIIKVFSRISISKVAILYSVSLTTGLILIFNKYYIFRAFGFRLNVKNLILIHYVSLASNYTTPAKIGYPLNLYLFNKLERIPYIKTAALMLIELVVSMGICGAITFIGATELIVLDYDKLISFASYLLLGFLLFAIVVYFFKGKISKSQIFPILNDVTVAVKSVEYKKLFVYILLMVVNSLSGSFLFLLIVLFTGGELTYPQAIVVSSASFFLGAVSMIPLGLGVREGTSLYLLNHYGVSSEVAFAVITFDRVLSSVLCFIYGTIAGTILGIKNLDAATVKNEIS